MENRFTDEQWTWVRWLKFRRQHWYQQAAHQQNNQSTGPSEPGHRHHRQPHSTQATGLRGQPTQQHRHGHKQHHQQPNQQEQYNQTKHQLLSDTNRSKGTTHTRNTQPRHRHHNTRAPVSIHTATSTMSMTLRNFTWHHKTTPTTTHTKTLHAPLILQTKHALYAPHHTTSLHKYSSHHSHLSSATRAFRAYWAGGTRFASKLSGSKTALWWNCPTCSWKCFRA